MGSIFPGEEELSVAERNAGNRVDAEDRQHLVDPLGWAFELGKVADGRLVKDQMAPGRVGMRVLAAKLFVAEGRPVAEAGEDVSECGAVGDFGFGLDPRLVHAGEVFLVGPSLVSDNVPAAVFADPQDLAAGLQIPVGSVVERVVLKSSGSFELEALLVKLPFESGKRWYGDLDFDFRALHGKSIRLLGDRRRGG